MLQRWMLHQWGLSQGHGTGTPTPICEHPQALEHLPVTKMWEAARSIFMRIYLMHSSFWRTTFELGRALIYHCYRHRMFLTQTASLPWSTGSLVTEQIPWKRPVGLLTENLLRIKTQFVNIENTEMCGSSKTQTCLSSFHLNFGSGWANSIKQKKKKKTKTLTKQNEHSFPVKYLAGKVPHCPFW